MASTPPVRFGIHMGNSTISMAIVKDSQINIVPSEFGDRVCYSVITVIENDEIVVGVPAKESLARNSAMSVTNNFQFLRYELNDEEFKEAQKNCISNINRQPLQYLLSTDSDCFNITPYEVALKLFENLYEKAIQAAKSDEIPEAVLSVPIEFSQSYREQLVTAAIEAGFKIIQTIPEPTTALLAYQIGFDQANEKSSTNTQMAMAAQPSSMEETVLLYRIGGLTSDLSLFNVYNDIYQEIDRKHLQIGGNLLTRSLAEYIAAEFFYKYRLNPRERNRTMINIEQHAEKCKHILSTMQTAHIFIESLMDGIDFSQNISRARFESIIGLKLAMFIQPIEEMIAKHPNIKITKFIPFGGSMKIPKLKSTISSMFPSATVFDTIAGDEVIAIGCATQAIYLNAGLSDRFDKTDELDVTVLSYDVLYKDKEEDGNNKDEECKEKDANKWKILFKQGTIIPCECNIPIGRNTKGLILSYNCEKCDVDVPEKNTNNVNQARCQLMVNDKIADNLWNLSFRFQFSSKDDS